MHPIQQTRQLEVNWCKGAIEESSDQKLRTWWDEEGKQKPLQSLSGGFCKLVKVGDIKEIAESNPAQKTSVDLACIVVEVDPHFGERISMKVMDETGSALCVTQHESWELGSQGRRQDEAYLPRHLLFYHPIHCAELFCVAAAVSASGNNGCCA